MTDAKRANWYSDGENAARRIEDLLPVCDRPPAGDAAEPTLVDGRDVFLPILSGGFWLLCRRFSSQFVRRWNIRKSAAPATPKSKEIPTRSLSQPGKRWGLGSGGLAVAERKKMFCRLPDWR